MLVKTTWYASLACRECDIFNAYIREKLQIPQRYIGCHVFLLLCWFIGKIIANQLIFYIRFLVYSDSRTTVVSDISSIVTPFQVDQVLEQILSYGDGEAYENRSDFEPENYSEDIDEPTLPLLLATTSTTTATAYYYYFL